MVLNLVEFFALLSLIATFIIGLFLDAAFLSDSIETMLLALVLIGNFIFVWSWFVVFFLASFKGVFIEFMKWKNRGQILPYLKRDEKMRALRLTEQEEVKKDYGPNYDEDYPDLFEDLYEDK